MAERVGVCFATVWQRKMRPQKIKNIKIQHGLKRLQNVVKKCNKQQKSSGVNGREMGWDGRTMGAQGERDGCRNATYREIERGAGPRR